MRPALSVHIFTGGDPVSAGRLAGLPAPGLVLAADSGARLAAAAGRTVDVLVGDLDSIGKEALDAVFDEGTEIEAHPPDKDATDLELALAAALRRGADEITVIGGGGGRLDHLLGNAAVIASPALRATRVRWVLERETAYAVHGGRGPLTLPAEAGDVFSVIPVGGTAAGVTITGAKWNLHGETLEAGSSLGISNRALSPETTVETDAGVLLVTISEAGPGGPSPAALEERLDELTRRGALVRSDGKRTPLAPTARREGALERFLQERASG